MNLKRFKFAITQASERILKKDKKGLLKRIAAASMAGIIGLSTFASAFVLTVNAATVAKVHMVDLPRSGDPNQSNWGWTSKTFMNGWKEASTTKFHLRYVGDSMNICYCIQPGVAQNNGTSVTKYDETYWQDYSSNGTIEGFEIKDFIGRILTYGYTGKISTSWKSTNSSDAATMGKLIATQMLIWETVVGERDSDFNHITPPSGTNAIMDMVSSKHPIRSQIISAYNSIVSSIQKHQSLPSFLAQSKNKATTVELKWDGSKYTATLTDTNNLLGNFDFSSSDPNVTLTVSGNKLIVSSETAPSDSVTISASKKNATRVGTIVWSASKAQDVVTYAENISDPIPGYIKIQVTAGSIKIVKTSEDEVVSGISFTITGDGVNQTVTTGDDGTIQVDDLSPGTYTVTENSVDRYVPQTSQTVTVTGGEVATVTFNNTLKKFRVTVTKTDKEISTAQGDATLTGAVYGIYNGDELIDTYATDANGQFTTDYYICGDNWSVREITPSEGYLLDETSYHVGAEAKLYTVEMNDTTVGVTEDVIKGQISITKHTDNGDTKIEIPEEGAEFAVYLKSAGSYDNAEESERDIITIDENGYAETKELPYGIYTVTQTKGWEGKEIHPDFDVVISEDGKVYRYIINNATMKSIIEIVKKDVETGKVIPVSGIGFKVLDCSTNEYITQHINYPTPMDIDTYYTDSTGKFMLPTELAYGNYQLIEVQAPEGYVLNSDPVSFTVDGSQNTVTVEKSNVAQKGRITITKTGEVFSSVTESNDIYSPVYKSEGLKGATYEVTAAEDIYTADGTKRYSEGDVVATVTTGDDGTAVTEPLYLGKYEIHETEAPYGMILSDEIHKVELTYAGQEVEITETATSFTNERQHVQINLSKSMEQDNIFNIGMNGEVQNVLFGIYASEDLTAADGSVIPKDGLIEIAACDEEGKLTFTTDLPLGAYYVREYSTDSHYVVSDTDYPVNFEYAGQDTKVVSISVNNGESINNDLIRGDIIGTKVDEDSNPIEGAVFGLFKADETDFIVNAALLLAKSDENGNFVFEDVPYGTWIVRELETTDKFVLNENLYTVTVSKDKENVEVEIENKFIRGSAQTTKVDADYPDHKLTGAVFEIYADADGDKEFNPEVDKLVGEMYEIEEGVYFLDDLRYGGYFLYEAKNPEGYVKDDAYYYFEITENGKTVVLENEAGVGFIDQPITEVIPATGEGDTATVAMGIGFISLMLGGALWFVKKRYLVD